MITQEYLKAIMRYDKKTGNLFWTNVSKYHSEKNGCRVGSRQATRNKVYLTTKVDGKNYKVHRLVFFYFYGFFPESIDHIDGNSLNNRIENLREATNYQNTQNHTRVKNGSGLPCGVRKAVSGRYQARITANKKVYHLGIFDTIEEAKTAYQLKRKEIHDAPASRTIIK